MQRDSFGSALILFALGFGLSGCTSIPPANSTDVAANLTAHVRYLAQPALKGRKPKTAGSHLAQQYIEARFQACGLVPWAKEKSYELPYALGKNIVGVLPGSDPAGEIVLVSAHYDHVGKDKNGIHPGAGDNASGVAAMLEIARQLSQASERPKRTVAFAAFDGEEQMLVGSFAFTCRPDVEKANIVAVVNVDMLGRDFLDVVKNTVFVTGTQNRPALQAQLRQFGSETGLRVLPIASQGVGPHSDHAAFENRVSPCLFFTCGTFKDYHKPTDTAEKLDYTNLARSEKLVLNTVKLLANEAPTPPPVAVEWDREELKSLQTITSEICSSPEGAIKPHDKPAVLHLKQSIDAALEKKATDDPAAAERVFLEIAGTIAPYLTGETNSALPPPFFPVIEHLYFTYQREILDTEKQIVGELLKHPHSFVHPLPPLRGQIYDLRDSNICFSKTATNGVALHALIDTLAWNVSSKTVVWPVKAPVFNLRVAPDIFDFEGSPDELTDYCLLRLYADRTNPIHAPAMQKLMHAVLGSEPQGNYTNWLSARLQQTGCSGDPEWMLRCMRSANPDLTSTAIVTARHSTDARIKDAICEIMRDPKIRADVRNVAMDFALAHLDRKNLLTLTEVLDDRSEVFKPEYTPQFQPDYPLRTSTSYIAMRSVLVWQLPDPKKTLGQLALTHLKRLSKKDYGTNAQAWQKWVRSLSDSQLKTLSQKPPA